MKSIFIITKLTIKESFKSKVFLNSLLIGVCLSVLAYLISELAYGDQAKVAIDIGLGFLFFSLMGISIFYGSTLINNELNDGNLYYLLPKISSRSIYFLGRSLGISLVLFFEACSVSFFVLLIYKVFDGKFNGLLFLNFGFIYLSSLVMLMVTTFFSQFTNNLISVLLSIFVYFIGYGLFSSLESDIFQNGTNFKIFLDLISYFFPNFYVLDIKDYLFYKHNLESNYIVQTVFSTLVYLIGLIIINLKIFYKRSF
tara:strand:- start:145 stop:909 length:765 start_codon:yes stop_codon:yes gene_type:complete